MFWSFRYLNVLSRSINIYISGSPQLDIQVGDLFPWISMLHWRRTRRAGPTSGATGTVRAVANGAHEWRRNSWAAPSRHPPAWVVWRLHQQRCSWTKAKAQSPASAAAMRWGWNQVIQPYPILVIFDIQIKKFAW